MLITFPTPDWAPCYGPQLTMYSCWWQCIQCRKGTDRCQVSVYVQHSAHSLSELNLKKNTCHSYTNKIGFTKYRNMYVLTCIWLHWKALSSVLNALKDYRFAFRHLAELVSQHNHSRRSLEGNSRTFHLCFLFRSVFTKQKTILSEHPEIQNHLTSLRIKSAFRYVYTVHSAFHKYLGG